MAASVPEARRFVTGLLAGCPAREVLVTCVSELSTNAIVHTASGNGGVFTVEVDLPSDGTARVSVTDAGGPSFPAAGSLRRSAPVAAGAPLDAGAPVDAAPVDATLAAAAPVDAASTLASAAPVDAASTLAAAAPVDLMAEGGRGLALVAAYTSRWGYADAHPGRTVWAEACWPVPVPPPGGPPGPPPGPRPGPRPGQEVAGQAPGQPRPRFLRLPPSPRRRSRPSPGPSGDYPSGPAA